MRQEVKFRFYPTELDKFFAFLHKNRLFQTYQPRNVSSIYYDSFDYSAAQSNLSGDLTRRKFRLRWYETKYPQKNATFEIKEKYNKDGIKRSFNVEVDHEKRHAKIKQKIAASLGDLNILFTFYNDPKSIVRYRRKYFENNARDLRVTLDTDIEYVPQLFSDCLNVSRFVKTNPQYVMELKYLNANQANVESMLKDATFINYRNSKYVQSIVE